MKTVAYTTEQGQIYTIASLYFTASSGISYIDEDDDLCKWTGLNSGIGMISLWILTDADAMWASSARKIRSETRITDTITMIYVDALR